MISTAPNFKIRMCLAISTGSDACYLVVFYRALSLDNITIVIRSDIVINDVILDRGSQRSPRMTSCVEFGATAALHILLTEAIRFRLDASDNLPVLDTKQKPSHGQPSVTLLRKDNTGRDESRNEETKEYWMKNIEEELSGPLRMAHVILLKNTDLQGM